MIISVQSNSFHASEKLIDFAKDKVSKLGHFSEGILEAQVILKVDKSDTGENKLCEIRLIVRGRALFAGKKASSFEEAISKTVDAIRQQVMTWKDEAVDKI